MFQDNARQDFTVVPFAVGAIVRYAEGRTALFRVTHFTGSACDGRLRYFGQHCMGGLYTAPHDDIMAARTADFQIWAQHASWRCAPNLCESEYEGAQSEI